MYTQRNMLRAVVCIKIGIRVVCIEVEGESDCVKAWPRGCIAFNCLECFLSHKLISEANKAKHGNLTRLGCRYQIVTFFFM